MRLLSLLFVSLVIVQVSAGQDSVLKGAVQTHAGAIIPAVKITATNKKGKEVEGFSNEFGEFELRLRPGIYRLFFEREGFKNTLVTDFVFNPTNKELAKILMEPGECNDCNGELFGERWDYYGTLTGTIYDWRGAVIRNAKITVRGEDGVDRSVSSNREGVFETRIMRGLNRIIVEATNFEIVVFNNFRAVRTSKGRMYLDISLVEKAK